MKFKRLFIFFLLLIMVACAGQVGPVGPAGPPGAAGVDGATGAPGICADDQCDGGGGESAFTREVEVMIYGGDGPMNPGAVKDARGFIKGDQFSCHFSIFDGLVVNEGAYMCVPVSDGQPSGYAGFFDGVGRWQGGPGSHGRTIGCISEWQRPPGVGNKWGVRIECPGYDPFSEDQLMGGAQYVGKRFPITAHPDDHWSITITIP